MQTAATHLIAIMRLSVRMAGHGRQAGRVAREIHKVVQGRGVIAVPVGPLRPLQQRLVGEQCRRHQAHGVFHPSHHV